MVVQGHAVSFDQGCQCFSAAIPGRPDRSSCRWDAFRPYATSAAHGSCLLSPCKWSFSQNLGALANATGPVNCRAERSARTSREIRLTAQSLSRWCTCSRVSNGPTVMVHAPETLPAAELSFYRTERMCARLLPSQRFVRELSDPKA